MNLGIKGQRLSQDLSAGGPYYAVEGEPLSLYCKSNVPLNIAYNAIFGWKIDQKGYFAHNKFVFKIKDPAIRNYHNNSIKTSANITSNGFTFMIRPVFKDQNGYVCLFKLFPDQLTSDTTQIKVQGKKITCYF